MGGGGMQAAGTIVEGLGGMADAAGEQMNQFWRLLGGIAFAQNAGNIGREVHRLGNTFGDATANLTAQTRGFLQDANNRLGELHARFGIGSNNLQSDAAREYLQEMRGRGEEAMRDIHDFAGQQLAGDAASQRESLSVNRDELMAAEQSGALTPAQRVALEQQAAFQSQRMLGNAAQQLGVATQAMRNEARAFYTGAIADAHKTLIDSIGNDREFALNLEQVDAAIKLNYVNQLAQLDNLAAQYYTMGVTYDYKALQDSIGYFLGVTPGSPLQVFGGHLKEAGQTWVALGAQKSASSGGGGAF